MVTQHLLRVNVSLFLPPAATLVRRTLPSPTPVKESKKKSTLGNRMSQTILTSGYSESLFSVGLDESATEKTSSSKKETDKNLTFAAYDKAKGNVYFVHEVAELDEVKDAPEAKDKKTGAVSRWKIISKEKGTLEKKEVFPSGGTDPAHVALDAERRVLYVTNYSGGSLSVFRLSTEDGAIQYPPIFLETIKGGSLVDKVRQEAAHLHGAFLHKDSVYVVDLGSDAIYHYRVKEGGSKVERAPGEAFKTAVQAGSGPRHLAIDEKRSRAYLINELQMSVVTFQIGAEGALKQLHSLDYTIPQSTEGNRQYGSEIALHPSGKWLYVSNRGDGAILCFSVSDSDKAPLEQVQGVSTGGTWPRHFTISEDGKRLLAADQFKHLVHVFKVDQESGKLEKNADLKDAAESPAMVLFL